MISNLSSKSLVVASGLADNERIRSATQCNEADMPVSRMAPKTWSMCLCGLMPNRCEPHTGHADVPAR
jgi:hypothetical protein